MKPLLRDRLASPKKIIELASLPRRGTTRTMMTTTTTAASTMKTLAIFLVVMKTTWKTTIQRVTGHSRTWKPASGTVVHRSSRIACQAARRKRQTSKTSERRMLAEKRSSSFGLKKRTVKVSKTQRLSPDKKAMQQTRMSLAKTTGTTHRKP